MAKKRSLTDTEVALSVLHHSLPIQTQAVLECSCTQAERDILDYALIPDASKRLNLPVTTIRRWIKEGRISSLQWHGNKPLVRLSEVRSMRDNRPTRGRPLKRKSQVDSTPVE